MPLWVPAARRGALHKWAALGAPAVRCSRGAITHQCALVALYPC
jgi:hypothetical protein